MKHPSTLFKKLTAPLFISTVLCSPSSFQLSFFVLPSHHTPVLCRTKSEPPASAFALPVTLFAPCFADRELLGCPLAPCSGHPRPLPRDRWVTPKLQPPGAKPAPALVPKRSLCGRPLGGQPRAAPLCSATAARQGLPGASRSFSQPAGTPPSRAPQAPQPAAAPGRGSPPGRACATRPRLLPGRADGRAAPSGACGAGSGAAPAAMGEPCGRAGCPSLRSCSVLQPQARSGSRAVPRPRLQHKRRAAAAEPARFCQRRRDLAPCSSLQERSQVGLGLFSLAKSCRTGGNGHKLCQESYRLGVRKRFSPERLSVP